MATYGEHQSMNLLIACLVTGLALISMTIVAPASAETLHAEGEGWQFNATATTMINPLTGEPYASLGAFEQAVYPGLWDRMSPAARDQANMTSAESHTFDLSYSLNGSQQAISRQLDVQEITEADYLSKVLPDLWSALPSWQKEQYAKKNHTWLPEYLPAGTGQFTSPIFTRTGLLNPFFPASEMQDTFENQIILRFSPGWVDFTRPGPGNPPRSPVISQWND